MAVYTLTNTHLNIKVNSWGAELCSVISNDLAIEYIWQADPAVWGRHAPHLFPIVGKLKEGTYRFQEKVYQLPQHGFARDMDFTCIEATTDTLCFELTSNEDTLKQFPFKFNFRITYTLQETKLTTHYSVSNSGSNTMYFSVGAHPAFNCPLQSHEAFEHYELQFPGCEALVINKLDNGLITSATEVVSTPHGVLGLSPSLFEKDALVFKNTQVEYVKLLSKETGHGVSLSSLQWPYFGIWTKPSTSGFICLEPWYGIADATTAGGKFEDKEGVICLEPSTQFSASFELGFF